MNLSAFRWRWLKTRITIFSLAVFLTSLWSLALYALATLRQDMERLVGDQQFSTVSLLATQIDRELRQRFDTLAKAAAGVTEGMLRHPADLQIFLEGRLLLPTYKRWPPCRNPSSRGSRCR
ncbi:MAG: hypothetical protein V5B32_06715 [Candidatus Accumulibacter sp. UW26]|jgi:hypothetical protein